MKRNLVRCSRFVAGIFAALLILPAAALAGPPLICHTINIGSAASLPWTSDAWNLSGQENYDLNHLVADTLALLTPNTPVLVRMETLRRATLYAQRDPRIAKDLLLKLSARATSDDRDALAGFDFGYLIECYKQANWLFEKSSKGEVRGERSNPATGLDGYAWVKKAINARGPDPEMEFAAALITIDGSQEDHQIHAQKAMAGADTDPLLAQNLASHFSSGNRGETISQILTRATTAKN
jgi:hypothetical protein